MRHSFQNVYFHVNVRCVQKKQPYFRPQMVILSDAVAAHLTPVHYHFLRDFGMSLYVITYVVLETRSTSGLRWIETANLTDICTHNCLHITPYTALYKYREISLSHGPNSQFLECIFFGKRHTEKVIDLKTFFEIFNCEFWS